MKDYVRTKEHANSTKAPTSMEAPIVDTHLAHSAITITVFLRKRPRAH